jgi:hypothetical protein
MIAMEPESAGLPMIAMEPESNRGLHLVVRNIAEARETLAGRGVEVGDIDETGTGRQVRGLQRPRGQHVGVAGDAVEISGLVVIATELAGVAAPAGRRAPARGGSAEQLSSATGADGDALERTLNGSRG